LEKPTLWSNKEADIIKSYEFAREIEKKRNRDFSLLFILCPKKSRSDDLVD